MTVRFPWPVLSAPVQVGFADLRLDGAPISASSIDQDGLTVEFVGPVTWERFACRVTVSVEEDVADLKHPLCHVIAESRETATRIPFPLGGVPSGGEVELLREEIVRDLTLTVEVAADHAGRRRIVGRSHPWTLRECPEHQIGLLPPAPVPMVWVDFTSPEAPVGARRSSGASALMENAGGAAPRLLLNSALPGFRDLLHADAARLERRRLRDLLGSDVARLATSSLLRAAVSQIEVAVDGTVMSPPEPLHRRVCASVAEAMVGVGSVEEFYEVAVAALIDDTRDIWSRADLAIDEIVGRRAAVETACEEIRVV